jgi:mRNA interferase HicA
MTHHEFIRWLKRQGVVIIHGAGRHSQKALLNGKVVPIPDHGGKEIGEGLRLKIIKELGL